MTIINTVGYSSGGGGTLQYVISPEAFSHSGTNRGYSDTYKNNTGGTINVMVGLNVKSDTQYGVSVATIKNGNYTRGEGISYNSGNLTGEKFYGPVELANGDTFQVAVQANASPSNNTSYVRVRIDS